MSKQKILAELNPEQKEAILHTQGPLLVIAGAGSGKTKVLTHRFAYLVGRRLPAQSILAVTFTNKAAQEMRHRIQSLLRKELDGAWIGTFHSQCARILRREIHRLGYAQDFSIYDEQDQLSLVRQILREMNIYEALYKGVLAKISLMKSLLISPEEFASRNEGFGFEERLARVYMRYQDELRRANALDFDDLIMLTIRLFQEHPQVLRKYQRSFRHVLVDEFQDTNPAQYKLTKMLSERHRNICAVGDDDQSIYRFRGASLENILNFEADFPDARVIKLQQSYRCTQRILDASGGLISKNPRRRPKALKSQKGHGEHICFCWLGTEEEEARYIGKLIKELYLKGLYSYRDFAVLYRVNNQSRALEEAFHAEGIPYKVLGSLSFYQRKEIKDIIAYLKLIMNRSDNVALKRVINSPARGIGAATLGKIQQHAKKKSLSFFAAMKEMLKSNGVASSMKEKLAGFVGLIEGIQPRKHKDAAGLIRAVLKQSGYLQELSPQRLEHLEEFIASAEGREVKEFVDGLSLTSTMDDTNTEEAVSLLTLHAAKGLEFPVVFIAGLEEGLIPYFKAEGPEALAEERRLLYVGMTRAKECLYLTGARRRRLLSKVKEQEPSRFLEDIPKDCCLVLKKAKPEAPRPKPVRKAPAASNPYMVGVRVRHPKWGEGVVRDFSGEGEEAKVTVNFLSVGLKKLVLKFANLQRM
jgi:DNA helicase-2/ATP-dependent DNA helicase PcrA